MSQDNIMGLAREQQPVYRHVLSNYRHRNPGTIVGDPPPNGLTGFNSGVKLMNLENMRNSELYNSILHRDNVTLLANKYNFRGHLGDQDFFSLVSFDHPSLFYTLPCQWNRQLCTWWKDNGYKDVFDAYFSCTEPFYVIHGNCNTPIPQEGDSSSNQKLVTTQKQVDEVVGIMRQNMDKVLERDTKLSDLDNRAENLEAGAAQFEANATKLKRKMWWQNCKMWIILIVVILIIIAVIVIWAVADSNSKKKKST
eukprot:gene15335-16912_t